MLWCSLMLCCLLLGSIPVRAQVARSTGNSDVRYVKDHLLYQRGEETNVIDINVEWPSMIDFSLVKPLQTFLAKAVFRVDADNLEDALKQMKGRFGKPVTSQFKTIPDDDQFCYVTCQLSEMGYQKNRFISFRATYICSPGKKSTQKADTTVTLITYDLINGKVLLMKDILKMAQLQANGVSYSVLLRILNGASVEVPDDIIGLQIVDACLMNQYLWLDMLYTDDDGTQNFHSVVKTDDLKAVMSRDARKLLTMDIPNHKMETVVIDSLYEGQPVYTEVDKSPEFRGGSEGLRKFLSTNVEYPQLEQAMKVQGRVTVSFLIDEEGRIRDPRVVDHVAPGIDREAVRVVRMMPKWTPGELKGQNVKVRYQLPITFKVQTPSS